MKTDTIVKTMPEGLLIDMRKKFAQAGKTAANAAARADKVRVQIVQDLMDKAKTLGVAPKIAVLDIMREVVKPCARTKPEQAEYDALKKAGVSIADMPEKLASKLSYSAGNAYGKCIEIAFATGVPFAPSLYAKASNNAAATARAEQDKKIRAAEEKAKAAADAAKAAAAKAAKAKTDSAKAEANKAKVAAQAAQDAVRKLIDAPTSKKTGGRKAAPKASGTVTLTRHAVALHFAESLRMLRALGGADDVKAADEIAAILDGINLLAK